MSIERYPSDIGIDNTPLAQTGIEIMLLFQRELMEQSWWGSLPWTWQDRGGRLDAQDGRGCACA